MMLYETLYDKILVENHRAHKSKRKRQRADRKKKREKTWKKKKIGTRKKFILKE